jgi:hypothetical protein
MLQNVPDPRGKQGQDYFLWSILGLIVVSLLCGRRGMLAAFHLGRSLNKRQRLALGFTKGVTPCHATLTETLSARSQRSPAAIPRCGSRSRKTSSKPCAASQSASALASALFLLEWLRKMRDMLQNRRGSVNWMTLKVTPVSGTVAM